MSLIMGSVFSGIGSLLLAALVAIIRLSYRTYKHVEVLVENDCRRSRQMQSLFAVNQAQTRASQATLEVVAGIKQNGNVAKAQKELEKIETVFAEFSLEEAWK